MVYVRLTVASLILVVLSLLVLESNWVHALLPLVGWSAVCFILALISWFFSRSITRIVLVPFSRISTRSRAVLVTGCDTGFGHLTALTLNRMGFFVIAACRQRNSDGAKKLNREAVNPSRIKVLQMDVTSEDEVREAFDTVSSVLKTNSCLLFGLVNNAGIMSLGETEFSPPQSVRDYSALLEVNTLGIIRVTRTFLPLIRQSHGRIVNISSQMARMVTPGIGAYCVSKAATSKFTEVLQVELSKFGVTVVGIEPWISKTNMITAKELLESLSQSWGVTPESVKAAYTKSYFYQLVRFMTIFSGIPFDVQPEQIVDAVVEGLTSPEPSPLITVCNTILSIPLWITNDVIPWEFIAVFRKSMFWLIFRLLSIEQLFTGRHRPHAHGN